MTIPARPRLLAFTASLVLPSIGLAARPLSAQRRGVVQPAATTAPAAASASDALLDALTATAVASHPAIRAARARMTAARARVGPAGLRPDPTLTVGLRDFPLSRPGFSDNFTMKMVGVSQTIPYPGKLGHQRRAAEREVEAAEAALAGATQQVARDLRVAYYDLAFLDRALDVVARNRNVLVDLIKVTEARYTVGTAGQQDVLRARVEAGRLAEQAVALTEQRRAVLAQLNAVLDRPSDAPAPPATIPVRIARAAVADSARHVRFASAALGARAADSPLPPLADLQATALRASPALREGEARIAAQAARLELAQKDYLPDVDVSFDYGQRAGYRDLVTATVSIPLRLQKGRKQDQLAAAARGDLAALAAEQAAQRNAIRAEVARLDAELERQRAQLALYTTSILPQGRASLTSALASYQVGRVTFPTLLDTQSTLFTYETDYFRVLTDFAKTLAELERVVGQTVLP